MLCSLRGPRYCFGADTPLFIGVTSRMRGGTVVKLGGYLRKPFARLVSTFHSLRRLSVEPKVWPDLSNPDPECPDSPGRQEVSPRDKGQDSYQPRGLLVVNQPRWVEFADPIDKPLWEPDCGLGIRIPELVFSPRSDWKL